MQPKRRRNHGQNKGIPNVSAAPDSIGAALTFSFKDLDIDHPRFAQAQNNTKFLRALMNEAKFYGRMLRADFVVDDHQRNRHTIAWEDTNEPDGFKNVNPVDAGTDVAWQFALIDDNDKAREWRVIGYVAEDTFYVVWLDSCHALTRQSE